MASHVHRGANELNFLGDEWSDEQSLAQCLDEFLFPYICVNRLDAMTEDVESSSMGVNHLPPRDLFPLASLSPSSAPSSSSNLSPTSGGLNSPRLTVAEIGVGGGRIASRVYPHVERLICFDIAEAMISQAKESIMIQHGSNHLPSNISFHLLSNSPNFPPSLLGTCDFVYSFDVLPHVDLHTIYGYFQSIKQLLKPNPPIVSTSTRPRPRVFLHTANLCAPLGFHRFASQSRPTAGGFHFISPEIIRTLADKCGYRIIQQSKWIEKDQSNADTDANSNQSIPSSPHAHSYSHSSSSSSSFHRRHNLYYQRDFLFVMEVK